MPDSAVSKVANQHHLDQSGMCWKSEVLINYGRRQCQPVPTTAVVAPGLQLGRGQAPKPRTGKKAADMYMAMGPDVEHPCRES